MMCRAGVLVSDTWLAQVDPLVSLMKVEKVPDSTYDMIGGLDQQIKEIKEVCCAAAAPCSCCHANLLTLSQHQSRHAGH